MKGEGLSQSYDWERPEHIERDPRGIYVDKTLWRKLAANENGYSHKFSSDKFCNLILQDVVPRRIAAWNAGKCLAKHTIDHEWVRFNKQLWKDIEQIDKRYLQRAGVGSRVINLAMLDEVIALAREGV